MADLIPENCPVQNISQAFGFDAVVDVLRLDALHPVVSGNKWFKLKEYLADAKASGKKTLLTFGGAYSNHIVATAAAAAMNGLQSIGVIRGERPHVLSHTLVAAERFCMHLVFVPREEYKRKEIPSEVFTAFDRENTYVVPEGGYGAPGRDGASQILTAHNTEDYTHIVTAVGTGTTLAGLTAAASANQKVIGIPVLKNATSLRDEICRLLPEQFHQRFLLLPNVHFGGYAKHTPQLLGFMNHFYRRTGIPTDFVYTGKAAFAAVQLAKEGFFRPQDRVLFVHTGGLQGNASLPKGRLIFG